MATGTTTNPQAVGDPPLAGLTVVDLGAGSATGIATMILADFGARVVRYPDPVHSHLDAVPSARMWSRGKAQGADLHGDIRQADVLVVLDPCGHPELDLDRLERLNPGAVVAGFGAAETGSGLPLSEPVVAAYAGRMQSLAGIITDQGPHFAAVPVATHASAQNLVAGILAAVLQRATGGGVQRFRTSLLGGLVPYDQGQSLALQLNPDREAPDPGRIMPTLNYHPVQCADGRWIQLGNLLPHLFRNFMRVIGLESMLEVLPENAEAVREAILTTLGTRSRDEWMALFLADGGIAAHPYQSGRDALNDPDMTANGHVVELDEVRGLGPVARLTRTPARITRDAKPAMGGDWGRSVRDRARQPPLSGLTVVELATIIASPLAASFLADMGARVIKVEATGGDPYRQMGGGIGAVRCNAGKESISLDLKTESGQRIVRRLVKDADVLIHNYRPGVPERLGIDFGTLSKLNPGLVYVSANGYGPDGPSAHRPSTHPIPGAALGGAGYQAGGPPEEVLEMPALKEAARRLMRANEVNPDPNTALVVVTASLLGLAARVSSGRGQQIFVDMLGANAYANFDDVFDCPNRPERRPLGPLLKGPGPLSRLYRAADGWIYLEITTAAGWQAFGSCAGMDAGIDPFAYGGSLEELEHAMESRLAERPAAFWVDRLATAGVACVRADETDLGCFFARAAEDGSEWMTAVRHETLGRYFRHRPMIRFGSGDPPLRSAPRTGVDGPALLRELGYSTPEIDALFEAGVLFSEDREFGP